MKDDNISRQAAIDAINHICPVDTEYDCTLLDRVDVRCVLSDLPPAQPEPQWIPCSERLPEEDQYNLVTMQHANGEIDVVIARLVKPYSKKVPWEWESDDAEWTWSFGNGFAWMPLPEPWRGEEHGE